MTDFFEKGQSYPHQLIDFLLGPIRWNMLHAALELEVFDQLESAQTATAVAQQLSLQEAQTELLLSGLCSIGILLKDGNQYQIKEELAPYLLSSSDMSMRYMLLHLSKVKHTDTDTIIDILQTGKSKQLTANFHQQSFWESGQKCLYSYHKSIHNDVLLSAVRPLPQWQEATSLLDLGAGSTALAEALQEEKPEMAVSLFDQPNCINYIEDQLSDDTNINLISGDFNKDDIGQGYDIILSSMSLYYAQDMQALLQKIKAALNEGGVFLSCHEALQDDRSRPERHITGRFLPAISGNDLSFDDGDIATQLCAAGFNQQQHHYIDSPMGQMRVDMAIKTS